MSNQKSRSLDDVLDNYLLSSQETGTDTLPEMVNQFPQYEQELRDLSAFRNLQASIPERAYTIEEEVALRDRAVDIVRGVLHDKRTRQEADKC